MLRQRLQGPSMLTYYPPTVNFKSIEKLAPSLGRLQDVREIQRQKDVERKKMLGKGPPKKGKFRLGDQHLLPHLCCFSRLQRTLAHTMYGLLIRMICPCFVRIVDHRRGSSCGHEGQEEVSLQLYLRKSHNGITFHSTALFALACQRIRASTRLVSTHCTFKISTS